jgi:hypothetical protein
MYAVDTLLALFALESSHRVLNRKCEPESSAQAIAAAIGTLQMAKPSVHIWKMESQLFVSRSHSDISQARGSHRTEAHSRRFLPPPSPRSSLSYPPALADARDVAVL